MTLLVLSAVALGCAALPAVLFVWNWFLFRAPPPASRTREGVALPPRISVLIPARNEEAGIAACAESVLASRGVELEVVVLDDHSEDRTAEVVRELARKDPRVRLEVAPPLPEGWCGKQHACHVLAGHARFDVLTFLDADVRLTPDALARMAAFRDESKAALASGFPRQETGTLLEKLVIPLINWVLLGFLPMVGMRRTRRAGFGAGCGQWFITTREAYEAVGGHAAVRASLHDGITLPRAYRRAGYHTDLCDATDLATCRMYRSARGVWLGLAKNAREGMAATGQILCWTVVLLGGQVLPFVLLAEAAAEVFIWAGFNRFYSPGQETELRITRAWAALRFSAAAVTLAYLPRLAAAWRFRQSWLGAVLHPLGVLTLLGVQWYAAYRAVTGRPVGWRGRPCPTAGHTSRSSAMT